MAAPLIAIACSKPPDGKARWAVRMLIEEVIRLKFLDNILHAAVHKALKKPSQTVVSEELVSARQAVRSICCQDGGRDGCECPA